MRRQSGTARCARITCRSVHRALFCSWAENRSSDGGALRAPARPRPPRSPLREASFFVSSARREIFVKPAALSARGFLESKNALFRQSKKTFPKTKTACADFCKYNNFFICNSHTNMILSLLKGQGTLISPWKQFISPRDGKAEKACIAFFFVYNPNQNQNEHTSAWKSQRYEL